MWGHPAEEERGERLLELLGAWNRLVFDSGVMFPLEHRLALSEFMDGQILLLVSSSQHMQWMDKYIAGKFNYGVVPLPGAVDQGVSPGFSAFALLAGEATENWRRSLLTTSLPRIYRTLCWMRQAICRSVKTAWTRWRGKQRRGPVITCCYGWSGMMTGLHQCLTITDVGTESMKH